MSEPEWTRARRAHEERLRPIVEPAAERRSRREKNPIEDFLFEYYDFGPRQLLRWSPGLGVTLEGPSTAQFRGVRGFAVGRNTARVDGQAFPSHRRPFLTWLRDLLRAVDDRPPFYGCSGMHEWAMLYRAAERRHPGTPLRVPPDRIDRVLEGQGLLCTHYDASRFFTDAALSLHDSPPRPDRRIEREQKACLHVNMDLYRWAQKLFPWISAELLGDTFLLALRIRKVDMRASPYDVSGFGLTAIPVETEAGRREYCRRQAELAKAADPLRWRLLDCVETLLGPASPTAPPPRSTEPDGPSCPSP